MSYCKEIGKDRIIFATKEDHETPSTITLAEIDNPNEPGGLIMPNGDINWNCPCLGGMASGPCGFQFREAFSCFHYSDEEVKGSNCVDKFGAMQECMAKYPNLYPRRDDEIDDEEMEKRINEIKEELGEEAEKIRSNMDSLSLDVKNGEKSEKEEESSVDKTQKEDKS